MSRKQPALFANIVAVAATVAACAHLALEVTASNGIRSQAGVPRRAQLSADTPVSADCRNGWELFRALANGSVESIRLMADIELYDADWSTFGGPMAIRRNLTVEGANRDRNDWFVVNMNFVKAKVVLGSGVHLTLRYLVLANGRAGPGFQAPGLDLVASVPATTSDGDTTPIIVMQDVALVLRTCLPPSFLQQAMEFPRPSMFPGNQSVRFNIRQDGCVVGCSVPPLQRCWPMLGSYDDLGTLAYNLDTASTSKMAGYAVHVIRGVIACSSVMDERCVQNANSIIGCFNSMFPPNSTSEALAARMLGPCPMKGAVDDGGHPSSDDDDYALHLGALLGGIFGGLALVAAVAGILLLARMYRRRRCHGKRAATERLDDVQQRQRQQQQSPSQASATNGGSSLGQPRAPLSTGAVAASEVSDLMNDDRSPVAGRQREDKQQRDDGDNSSRQQIHVSMDVSVLDSAPGTGGVDQGVGAGLVLNPLTPRVLMLPIAALNGLVPASGETYKNDDSGPC